MLYLISMFYLFFFFFFGKSITYEISPFCFSFVWKHCTFIFKKRYLFFRGIAINRVTFTGSLLKCWKKSVYQDTVVKCDKTSTYQELDISENAYQNTTIRWKTQIFLFRIYSSIKYSQNTTAITLKIQEWSQPYRNENKLILETDFWQLYKNTS